MNAEETRADARAREVEGRMTDDERLSLLVALMPVVLGRDRDGRVPPDVPAMAAWAPGAPRLGVPALRMTDASLGITNPNGGRPGDSATALPAGLALGATFNPALAREVGGLLGREARAKGFNVLLGGGMNLVRDPRNGRNFEYLSEDPLLSGVLAAEAVIGTQAEGVVSTVKHFSLNANETNRHWLDAIIDPAAHRESDLLAFEIAIERGRPGAVMGAYNMVNGEYACGSETLLNGVLKGAWGYPGWVMSDWGAVHDWTDALRGLDQECGAQIDKQLNGDEWFDGPLQGAFRDGRLPRERLSDMVRRILRSIYAVGADEPGAGAAVDMAAHDARALEVARQGIVLLKNEGLLPLPAETRRIAVIGGQAHLGVPTGGGSSLVTPPGGFAAVIPMGGQNPLAGRRNQYFFPGAPRAALRTLLPGATITHDPGAYPAEAAEAARRAEVAIVFVTKPECEGFDSPDLTLPYGQDALIEAVAAANPRTIVVLETGNPIAMPWRDRVGAIVAAWYPGQAGGRAMAEVLTGAVNPSGRLPVTFPVSLDQTPRPELPGLGTPWGTPTTVEYREGAEVGYRWFATQGATPLYAFGHGLSYTRFEHGELSVKGGETISASVTVTNTGDRGGADVPQLYLTEAAGDRRMRLLGFERVELGPGESRRVEIVADPRLLARFDGGAGRWRVAAGTYRVALGRSAGDLVQTAAATLDGRSFGR